jgi:hypothetical protein
VLNHLNDKGRLIGLDIVDDMVDFCRAEISSRYPNSQFLCLDVSNQHYAQYIRQSGTNGRVDQGQFFSAHRSRFDLAYAFSVFTHLGPEECEYYIRAIAESLKVTSSAVLTFFLLDAISIQTLKDRTAKFSFDKCPKETDTVFFGSKDDPTYFVAYHEDYVKRALLKNGLCVEKIIYGTWRGIPSSVYQDHVIVRPLRQGRLPSGFDPKIYYELNPDVAEAGADAVEHYLLFGYKEGRPWK